MDDKQYKKAIQGVLDQAIKDARKIETGEPATYIPELAQADPNQVCAAVQLSKGSLLRAGDQATFTLQSAAKLVVLIGLLEEYGLEQLLTWTNAEPSGQSFASISHLDLEGPIPSNPMINSGAIALCGRIPGDKQAREEWLHHWMEKLFGQPLSINKSVFHSEIMTGHRNRSIAYLLKSEHILDIDVESVLDTYFKLCSFEVDIETAAQLPALLARGGKNMDGQQVIAKETCHIAVSIMATCGLYDESGTYLVHTGLPAKSGVSGVILAVATGRAGIAVMSPRLNSKGGSVRGHCILQAISKQLRWHFADPWVNPKSVDHL